MVTPQYLRHHVYLKTIREGHIFTEMSMFNSTYTNKAKSCSCKLSHLLCVLVPTKVPKVQETITTLGRISHLWDPLLTSKLIKPTIW